MKLLLKRSAQKELDNLPDKIVLGISRKILDLTNDSFPIGSQKLAGGKGYRIRIGDYRVLYTVDKSNKTIVVIKIGHRRDVYKS